MESLQNSYLEAISALGKAETYLLTMEAEVNVTSALTKISSIQMSLKPSVFALFRKMRLSQDKMDRLKHDLLVAGNALAKIDR